jgi:hypothetical protein
MILKFRKSPRREASPEELQKGCNSPGKPERVREEYRTEPEQIPVNPKIRG